LDIEIEKVIRLMMKVPQKKTTVRKPRSSRKRKTAADCERKASGAKQHKVWKLGEQQPKKNCRTKYGIQEDQGWKHMIWRS